MTWTSSNEPVRARRTTARALHSSTVDAPTPDGQSAPGAPAVGVLPQPATQSPAPTPPPCLAALEDALYALWARRGDYDARPQIDAILAAVTGAIAAARAAGVDARLAGEVGS